MILNTLEKAKEELESMLESKRDFNEDGTPFYKKHKIYLYKEDFESFKHALSQVSEFIIEKKGTEIISNTKPKKEEDNTDDQEESGFKEVDLNEL